MTTHLNQNNPAIKIDVKNDILVIKNPPPFRFFTRPCTAVLNIVFIKFFISLRGISMFYKRYPSKNKLRKVGNKKNIFQFTILMSDLLEKLKILYPELLIMG